VTLTFLDNRPVFPGHCLVVPKTHYETLSHLPVELIEPLFSTAKLIASAMPSGLGAEGTFVAVNNRVSQSVPHLHVHVVPRRFKDGLRGFFWPRRPYADESEARRVQEALIAAVSQTAV
jgi:histidine triad (HIT) family protein